MSFPHGTYLGGVRTVEDMRQRCRIDADTGCWHWGMGCSGGKPRVRFTLAGVEYQVPGRRAALMLRDGAVMPSKMLAIPIATCKSDDCVNPAHSRYATKVELGAQQRKRGSLKGMPAKVAANRRIAIAKRQLSDEQVGAILHTDRRCVDLAREFGCSVQLVSDIRAGRRYLPHTRGASVFAWRPA